MQMLFALILGLTAGGFAAGLKFGKSRIALGVCLGAIAIRALLIYTRPLDARLLPFDGYPAIEWWWAAPFAAFVFGAAARRVTSFPLRDVLWVAEGIAFLYFGLVAWGESFSDHAALSGEVNEAGVCPQTSGYSCGPAAAATFLHTFGVRASEREMAVECRTTRFFGTSLCGLLRGLNRKVPVEAGRLDATELEALRRPALVIVKTKTVDHWLVVDRFEGGAAYLRDPAGMTKIAKDEFERIWRGLAVWSPSR